MISIFPSWTFHSYVATFQQHLHMAYISLRACASYQDSLDRGLLITRKILNQGFLLVQLKSSHRKFYVATMTIIEYLCHKWLHRDVVISVYCTVCHWLHCHVVMSVYSSVSLTPLWCCNVSVFYSVSLTPLWFCNVSVFYSVSLIPLWCCNVSVFYSVSLTTYSSNMNNAVLKWPSTHWSYKVAVNYYTRRLQARVLDY